MADTQPQTPAAQDEILDFITEGMHRLATISTNDYGFLLSARMAQTYLERAIHILGSKHALNRAMASEIKTLQAVASGIAQEYAEFETFCDDSTRFNLLKTKNLNEWLSKCAVRTISSAYQGTVGPYLAHKIRTFHARACSLLTDE